MSNVQSYNALIDRFKAFASGHFILKTFSHGQIDTADLEKFTEYPFMHVVPSNVTYAKGTKTFSFQIVLADLPRDKDDKVEFQREVLSDLQRIAEDLVAEITNHRVLFGDLITVQNVSLEPFLEEFHNTLTGWTVSLELLVPYYWDACSIPAEWNDMFESGSGGTGSILTFIDSITRDENGNVSLVNDEATPAPNYYYGTNEEGVRGWYLSESGGGLTCETIGSCQTIIDIEAAIDALEEEILLKANTADLGAVAFSNDYDDLDNKPTIPDVSGFVPYTGATTDVDLGTHDLTATQGTFATSGNPDTLTVNHSSGSGKALTITKGGAGEGIYVNKTSGSGNAVTIVGDLEATTLKKTGGTSSQFLKADGSVDSSTYITGLTVGTTPITSGTVGRVLFEGTGNVLQESANLFWDNTNSRLGIGTATPDVTSHIVYSNNTFLNGLLLRNTNTGTDAYTGFGLQDSSGNVVAGFQYIPSTFSNVTLRNTVIFTSTRASKLGFVANGTNVLSQPQDIYFQTVSQKNNLYLYGATGNLVLQNGGSFTDAGFRLDVNGTARVQGNAQFGTGFYWNNTNGRLGIGTASPQNKVDINLGVGSVTNGVAIRQSSAFGYSSVTLYDNRNSTSFVGQFGLYGNGVAAPNTSNMFFYNSTGGGTAFYVGSGASPTNDLRMLIAPTGNVLIGTTTDAGYKLDVNGTARVSGQLTTGGRVAINGTTLIANAAMQVNGTNQFVNYNASFLSGSFYTYQAFGAWEAIGADSAAGTILSFGGYRASQWTGITFHSSGVERLRIKSTGQVRYFPLASAPTGQAGDVYYDSTLNKLRVHNGTAWETITSV